MNKDQKKAIQQLLQSGALSLLEEVIGEIRATLSYPEFKGSTDQLTYDVAKYVGINEGLDMVIDNIIDIAQDV